MPKRKGFITRQAKRLSDGEINRRRFVMSALSAGVTMPTALSLASKAEAMVPKPGGTLRVAVAERESFDALFAFARGNALTEIAADGSVAGELAERFEASPDFTRWRFALRDGVTFHDGAPLSTQDVVASLAGLPGLRRVRAISPLNLELVLKAPNATLPELLARPDYIIRSAETGATTGGYMLEGRATEDAVSLVRNPNYWKGGRAHLATATLTLIPDVSARQHAIMAGDVDYADGIDPRALALLSHSPGIVLRETSTGRHIALTPRNVNILRRLEGHLPEDALVAQILLGHGAPASAMPLSETTDLPKRLTLAVRDTGVPRTIEAARLIARHLDARGCDVSMVSEDAAADLEIGWHRDCAQTGSRVLIWANDIVAHAEGLVPPNTVASDAPNDGARLVERWWRA